jgi:hypothetical protein
MEKLISTLAIVMILQSSLHAQQMNDKVAIDLSNVEFIKYSIDSLYTIAIPDYLIPVSNLSSHPPLQFNNEFMNAYMLLASERKQDQKGSDLNEIVARFKSNVKQKGGDVMEENSLMIAGFKAASLQVNWAVEGVKFRYWASFIDTPKTLYKIYSWTLESQDYFEEDFKKMAKSFEKVKGKGISTLKITTSIEGIHP